MNDDESAEFGCHPIADRIRAEYESVELIGSGDILEIPITSITGICIMYIVVMRFDNAIHFAAGICT